jgi:uncharacterized membrane protein
VQKYRSILFVLVVLYTVGIIGIGTNYWSPFILLTPINLLVSLGLVLWNHPSKNTALVVFVGLVFIIGWSAEWFGVHTGLLFGQYAYGKTLGPKVAETPLMIGINWVMITYTAGMVVNQIASQQKRWMKIIIAAVLMVGIDFFIEPIAPLLDFWSWENNSVPIQNYWGWLGISLLVQFIFFKLIGDASNKAGSALFFVQLGFFVILNIIL